MSKKISFPILFLLMTQLAFAKIDNETLNQQIKERKFDQTEELRPLIPEARNLVTTFSEQPQMESQQWHPTYVGNLLAEAFIFLLYKNNLKKHYDDLEKLKKEISDEQLAENNYRRDTLYFPLYLDYSIALVSQLHQSGIKECEMDSDFISSLEASLGTLAKIGLLLTSFKSENKIHFPPSIFHALLTMTPYSELETNKFLKYATSTEGE